MHFNFLAFAIPFFLLFIGLEYYLSRRKGRNFFQYAESIANLNVGIAERLLDVFMTGVFFWFFKYIHDHFALFNIQATAITWMLLFVLTDLVWYWYHRLAHEINAFWAVHVVHHQSEDFNYTVSARITVFQAIVRSLFWAILPLIGFPPLMISTFLLIHGLYPFFIHTRAIGKWGWLEYILVTPTHHGIHHASNPEYLDKNYGDVFIFWDKLFGTFANERKDVAIVYGLTKPLKSHSFLWQHFHFPLEIYMNFRHAKGPGAKWRTIFGRPDDLDPRYRAILERKFLNAVPRQREPTPAIRQYVTVQTLFALCLLFIITLFEHYLTTMQLVLLSAFILISLVNSGALLDQRRWIFYLEYIRALIVIIATGVFYPGNWSFGLLVLVAVTLTWYFRPIRRYYLQQLFATQG